ncbi:hypothetical protein vseg_009726 [Gypsophila vaccaria]
MARIEFMAAVAMVIVQAGNAGLNLISKVAMDSGMPPFVLVAYRQLFAALFIVPFAFYSERNTRPKITKKVLFQIFQCSLFGACLNQVFFFIGLKKSTATIASALTNMLPAFTFLLAIAFRLERVRIRTRGGQAKIIGTLVCVGGAMLLTFYHGPMIHISPPDSHWAYLGHLTEHHVGPNKHRNSVLGSLLILAATVFMAIWYILQAKVSKNFQAPYTSSALMSIMGSIQCTAIAACTNHSISDWSLRSWIRLTTSIYVGLVCSALAVCLISWTIQRKGPLYVSVFSPLLLVIVAFLSWALRMEKLYVGTVMGSVLIVVGLYTVLWGKSKEIINATHKMAPNEALDQAGETQNIQNQNQLADLKAISVDPSLSDGHGE